MTRECAFKPDFAHCVQNKTKFNTMNFYACVLLFLLLIDGQIDAKGGGRGGGGGGGGRGGGGGYHGGGEICFVG